MNSIMWKRRSKIKQDCIENDAESFHCEGDADPFPFDSHLAMPWLLRLLHLQVVQEEVLKLTENALRPNSSHKPQIKSPNRKFIRTFYYRFSYTN